MKKQSVILLLMFPWVLTAQKINFAAEVGFGASNVHTNEASGISNVSGFNAGVSARLRFSKKVCFNSGLFYSPKGAQRTISKQNSTVNTRRVINYFEFPANIIYYFNSETLGGLFVSGGMYAGVALGGYTRTTVTDSDREIKKNKQDILFGEDINQVRRFDYGLSFGLGYQSPLGIYVRGQYDLGLQNVVHTKYVYNRSFHLMIGYIIKQKTNL